MARTSSPTVIPPVDVPNTMATLVASRLTSDVADITDETVEVAHLLASQFFGEFSIIKVPQKDMTNKWYLEFQVPFTKWGKEFFLVFQYFPEGKLQYSLFKFAYYYSPSLFDKSNNELKKFFPGFPKQYRIVDSDKNRKLPNWNFRDMFMHAAKEALEYVQRNCKKCQEIVDEETKYFEESEARRLSRENFSQAYEKQLLTRNRDAKRRIYAKCNLLNYPQERKILEIIRVPYQCRRTQRVHSIDWYANEDRIIRLVEKIMELPIC